MRIYLTRNTQKRVTEPITVTEELFICNDNKNIPEMTDVCS